MSASARARAGTPDQRSGGAAPAPAHVKRRGIAAPDANAGLVTLIVVGACELGTVAWPPPPQPASAKAGPTRRPILDGVLPIGQA